MTASPRAAPSARELHIRPLAEADFPSVLAIQDACYTAIVPESAASLRAKWQASPETCLAACSGAQVTGYLIAVPIAWPHVPPLGAETFDVPDGADTLYLHDLALGPAARGTGAGAALVDAVLAAGRRQGRLNAGLVAIQGSAPYWRRFGFRAVKAPPGVQSKLASYGDAVLMQRALGVTPD